jgi:predicted O-methyltransferase YrrM
MDTVVVAQRYAFLEQLHELIKPRGYLEIGVQHGGSLALAKCEALGIDPAPLVLPGTTGPHARVQVAESDFFFRHIDNFRHMVPRDIDLAFIDGMHLVEYAFRDFMNVERLSHSKTVIVFDDVLPYSRAIAGRAQPVGDWTGDVWRIMSVFNLYRKDLRVLQVDTFPTGSLVVFHVDPSSTVLRDNQAHIEALIRAQSPEPPDWVLNRTEAVSMEDALKTLGEWL